MILDKWQEKVLQTKGNICLRSGRQVGKSTIIAKKAAEFAIKHRKKTILIIAKTDRQSLLLFSKILNNIMEKHEQRILGHPLKHELKLTNGSIILSLPAGDTGYGIMGYTVDLLIADEAAFIPEAVWTSLIPSLAITRGTIWLLSTPFVKKGYYYNCFSDPKFTPFHTSSEDCPRKDQSFLDHQKSWMTTAQYAQMYLGQFRDELSQFYPDELIRKCCIRKRRASIAKGDYFIGCDVARRDRDEFTFEIIDRKDRKKLIQVENIMTKDIPIPESVRRIITLNSQYNFREEFIDSGGMGITVCDLLRENDDNKRKVVEINNASRRFLKDGEEKTTGILKEDLYENLLNLMQTGKIELLDDDEIKESLKSIQYEYPKEGGGKMKIWGAYDHIAEGLIRAAWCHKSKSLNIWIV